MKLANAVDKLIYDNESLIGASYNSSAVKIDSCHTLAIQSSYTVASTKSFLTAAVTVATSRITIPSHGFVTGIACTLTTDGADLPAPLAVLTTYYVIKIDASTIKLATSLNNANAGTAITLSDAGTAASTLNVVITAATVALSIEQSLDSSTWFSMSDAVAITSSANSLLYRADSASKYVRLVAVVSGGQANLTSRILAKERQ